MGANAVRLLGFTTVLICAVAAGTPSLCQAQVSAASPDASTSKASLEGPLNGWSVRWSGSDSPKPDSRVHSVYPIQNVQGRWVALPQLTARDADAQVRNADLEFVWLRPAEKEVLLLARPGPKVGQETGLSMCKFGRESDRTQANRRSYGYTHCNSVFSKCDGRASDALLAPLTVLTLTKVCFVVLDEEQLVAAVNQAGLGGRLRQDAAEMQARREQAVATEQLRKDKAAADVEASRARIYRGQGLVGAGAPVEVALVVNPWGFNKGEISISSSIRFQNTGRAPVRVSASPIDTVRTKDGRVFAMLFRESVLKNWGTCQPISDQVIINPGQTCEYSSMASIPAALAPDDFAATGSAAIEAVRVNGADIYLVSASNK